jgi:3-oxoadipate enol-lactonase
MPRHHQASVVVSLVVMLITGIALGQDGPPERGMMVDVEDGELYCVVEGSGPALVLLHDGLLGQAGLDALAQGLAADFSVIRYDRRGFGRSPQPTAPYDDVADLELVLETLGAEPAVLVGASRGGELALRYAAAHPDAIAGLVLVGPWLDDFSYSAQFVHREVANGGATPLERADRWIDDPNTFAPDADTVRETARRILHEQLHHLDWEKYRYRKASERIDWRLPGMEVPVLIMVGAADTPDAHAHAGAMHAAIPAARRVVVEQAGHLAAFEQPEAVLAETIEFLSLLTWRNYFDDEVTRGVVPLEGGALYYETLGFGDPVVLVHGGIIDHRMWDAQFEALAESFNVIRYDVRGYGLSPDSPGTHRDHDDLAVLLASLGHQSAHIVGLSMGGRIAADFALAHPGMVDRLVLVGPGITGFPFDSEQFQAYAKKSNEAAESGDMDQLVEVFIEAWTDGPDRSPDEVDPEIREQIRRMATRGFALGARFSRPRGTEPPARQQLGRIEAETLVIVGSVDMDIIHVICDGVMQELPYAHKVVVENTAHMVNMEEPETFNALVTEFLTAEE